jgi:hypothetical protein
MQQHYLSETKSLFQYLCCIVHMYTKLIHKVLHKFCISTCQS